MASKRKSTVDRITEIGIVLVDLYGGREWSTNALVNYAASLLQNLNNLKLVTRPYSGSVGIKESNDHEGIASPRQMKDTVWGGGGTRSIKSLEHLF